MILLRAGWHIQKECPVTERRPALMQLRFSGLRVSASFPSS
jgi:hypothetical protein